MLETILSNRTASVLWEALPRILSAGLTMTIPPTGYGAALPTKR